jgi:hypothetical protein
LEEAEGARAGGGGGGCGLLERGGGGLGFEEKMSFLYIMFATKDNHLIARSTAATDPGGGGSEC